MKNRILIWVASIMLVGILCYVVGYGNGQASAYNKMNDNFSLSQLWKVKP